MALETEAGVSRNLAGPPADWPARNPERVPTRLLSRLWRAGLAATGDPFLGIKVGSNWRFGALQVSDYLFETAPTLVEAIGEFARYAPLINTARNEIRLTGGEDDGRTLTFQVRSGDGDVDAAASQAGLVVVLSRARHALGREIRPLRITLTSPAPARCDALAGWLGARLIDFGAERCTMTLAPVDLAQMLPTADPELRALLQQYAAGLIAAQASGPPTWADRLRHVMAAQLAVGAPSLPAAAHRLALSPRSLQRRLEDEGTTWREVLDGVRRERTEELLSTGLGRTSVAARSGFSDARALRRALRRWSANRPD